MKAMKHTELARRRHVRSLLLSAAAISMLPSVGYTQDTSSAANQLGEVIITANRRSEEMRNVPISVAAFSREKMDALGVKQFDDLIKFTPGLNLNRSVTGANQVAIRGISSAAGAATTGIYIDDVPIQVRNLEYGSGTLYPAVFDLERVEVLRGPQGTLFGAGSEGGTIRFIQAAPSVDRYSAYARSEFSTTEGGASSYEFGVAGGGPLVEDKLAFRGSVFYRRDGGYIDRVTGTPTIVDPSGASPDSLNYITKGVFEQNSNWSDTKAARLALKAQLTDEFSAQAAVSYQKQYFNDAVNSFWVAASDPSSGQFRVPIHIAGAPGSIPDQDGPFGKVNAVLGPIDGPNLQQGSARFVLPSLTLEYDNGAVAATSVTAYFDRASHQYFDFTRGYARGYTGIDFPVTEYKGNSNYQNFQKNFTQEVRVQSSGDGKLQWLVGGFYSHMKQFSPQDIAVNFLAGVNPFFGAVNDGPPFGPGYSAFVNFFGMEPLPNSTVFVTRSRALDEQKALFGQVDFDVFEHLTLTAGLRYSWNNVNFSTVYDGPENVLNSPYGAPCPTGTVCVPGQGDYIPQFPIGSSMEKDQLLSPKFTITYHVNDDSIVYATAAKGYRPGGGQIRLPGVCNTPGSSGLAQIGYVDSNGNSTQPTSYSSDTVWSYEAGTKTSMLGGRLYVDGSGYVVKWKGIQQQIFVPICGYAFVDNVGSATSRGFDLAINASPFDGMTVGTAIGYHKTTLDKDIFAAATGVRLFRKGQNVSDTGAPWTVHVYGQYNFMFASDRTGYVRVDYAYESSLYPAGARDPQDLTYANLPRVPSTNLVNGRVGTRISDVDVSLFVNNALNATPHLALAPGGAIPQAGDTLWTDSTFRPRTIGITASYRY